MPDIPNDFLRADTPPTEDVRGDTSDIEDSIEPKALQLCNWIVAFIIRFQTAFYLSDAAIQSLLHCQQSTV